LVLLKTLAHSEMGSRIVALRRKAGLSQAQLAEAPEDSAKHTFFLQVRGGRHSGGASATDGIGVGDFETKKQKRAGAGPIGRMRHLFEAAPKLPRSQEEKIEMVLKAFVNQFSSRKAPAAESEPRSF
jgi:hypothetical protein